MRAAARLVLPTILALTAASVVAQDGMTRRYEGGVFAVEIPSAWRRLLPNEVVELRDLLEQVMDPNDALSRQNQVIGDVDEWTRSGFDGRALIVYSQPFELPVNQETLDGIVAVRNGAESADGTRQEILAARLTEIGPSKHPAIEVELLIRPPREGAQPLHVWDYYASSSGQKLILSFRAWENAAAAAESPITSMVGSIIFAQRPQDRGQLGDRLLWAIAFGALTGLALLLARFLRRRGETT